MTDIASRYLLWTLLLAFLLPASVSADDIDKQLLAAGAKIDPTRWTTFKEILATPWHLLQGKVIDLNRPPSLLEAAQESGNEELYQFLKKQGAR